MNPIDIEKYKNDMMKLYNKRTPSENPTSYREPEPTVNQEPVPEANENQDPNGEPYQEPIPEANENQNPNGEPYQEPVPEANENTETVSKDNEEKSSEDEQQNSISERFPEPDLSELVSEYPVPKHITEESLGDSTGYILVNVRTGRGAYPIENASVIVTSIVDGNRFIIASALTDINGATIKIETPAPALIYSQSPDSEVRPYSLFDISVKADGYFNARSVDVPVFFETTSIQNFNMIPVPLGMRNNDETLTYFNQEPNL